MPDPNPNSPPEGLAGTTAKWILASAFFAIPLTALRPFASATFGDLLLALAVLAAGVLVLKGRRPPPLSRWVLVGAALLGMTILLSIAWPPVTEVPAIRSFGASPYGSSVGAGVRLLLALVAVPLVVAVIASRKATVWLFANAWIAGATLSCLVAVIDASFGTNLQVRLADNPAQVAEFLGLEPARSVGLAVHPTSFSVVAAMVFPLVLAKMDRPRRALIVAPLVLALCLGVVLSGSRVGMVGLGVALVLTLVLDSRVRRTWRRPGLTLIGTYAAVLAATLIVFVLGPPAALMNTVPDGSAVGSESGGTVSSVSRLDPLSISAKVSNEERLERMWDSIDLISQRPLSGYGYQWIEASHNIYLQLLVAGGIFALVGFASAMFGYLEEAWSIRRRLRGAAATMATALLVSMITFLVMGLFQTDLLDRYLYLPAGLVLAMSILVGVREGATEISDSVASAPRHGLTAVEQVGKRVNSPAQLKR